MIEFTEMDDDYIDWSSDYYGLSGPTPKRVRHLFVVEITDSPTGDHSMLVQSAVNSLSREIDDMRSLLHKTVNVRVNSQHRLTAGRYTAEMIDHARGMPDLSVNHKLVTYPAEEGPGLGRWTDDFDWDVEHPDNCTIEARFDDLCPFETEIEYEGRDAFGTPSDWPEPPFEMRVRHVVHEYPAGPWGGPEFDIYIEQDPEE